MSYRYIFTGAAAALALASQVATAQVTTNPVPPTTLPQDALAKMLSPEAVKYIGDLDIQVSLSVAFDKGRLNTTTTNIDVKNIQCDAIQPFVEKEMAKMKEYEQAHGIKQTPEGVKIENAIRTFFKERRYEYAATETAEDLLKTLSKQDLHMLYQQFGPETLMMMMASIPQESTINFKLACAETKAPTVAPQ